MSLSNKLIRKIFKWKILKISGKDWKKFKKKVKIADDFKKNEKQYKMQGFLCFFPKIL